MKLVIFLILLSIPLTAVAAPTVISTAGTLAGGQQITITGSDFGATGPTLSVFADFESSAVAGELIPLPATVGVFDGSSSAIYSNTARSGDLSGLLAERQMRTRFSPVTEVYVSYAIYAPSGSTFPHSNWSGTHTGASGMANLKDSNQYVYVGPSGVANLAINARAYNITDGSSCLITNHTNTEFFCQLSGGTENDWDTGDVYRIYRDPETWPRESFLKIAWLGDPDKGALSSYNDQVLFSFSTGTSGTTGGNDMTSATSNSLTVHHSTNNWWTYGKWQRLSFWLRANPTNPSTSVGQEWAQVSIDDVMQQQFYTNAKPTFGGGTAPYQFTGMNFWGWSRDIPDETSFNLLFDDIYLATGPNAAARVEIGNASIYSAATKLAIATPNSWANTEITATIREGSFADSDEIYLFVINADNEPSVGYGPLILGTASELDPPTCETQSSECLNQIECETAEWYWYNNTCNAVAESTCSNNPNLCTTENTCNTAGWTWQEEQCWDYWEPPFINQGRATLGGNGKININPSAFGRLTF